MGEILLLVPYVHSRKNISEVAKRALQKEMQSLFLAPRQAAEVHKKQHTIVI